MAEKELAKKLDNYKYDAQYLEEKRHNIDNMKLELNKLSNDERMQEKKDRILEKIQDEENKIIIIAESTMKIENEIDLLSQPYKTIFYFRYIKGYTFDEIALKMHYSTKRIYQLHKEGINDYLNKHYL